MYLAMVVLLLVLCPLATVGLGAMRLHHAVDLSPLIGRSWTFWAVGIRLLLAGLRQTLQPRFTAEEIFGIRDPASLPLVREIGFGNLAMGILGTVTAFRPDWTLPAAIAGGLYYGLAGLGHIPQTHKNTKENVAMLSDLFVSLILASFILRSLA